MDCRVYISKKVLIICKCLPIHPLADVKLLLVNMHNHAEEIFKHVTNNLS